MLKFPTNFIWIFYYTYKRSGYKNILDSTTQNNNKINTSSLITRRGILYKSISCFIILHVNFLSSHWLRVFYYTERDVRCKMMGVGKIIDVAVKKTSHSIHLPKRSHQTKSQEFPEHFHSFTHIIFQFKFRLWLCDLLNRSIDSDIKVLNREGDRLNYHTLPCDRLKWQKRIPKWQKNINKYKKCM
jgi:hypothetical protein